MTLSESIERTILGYCLQDDPEAVRTAASEISPEHFYLDSHQRIFSLICRLAQSEKSVNIVTVTQELGLKREISSVGGHGYIIDLTSGIPAIQIGAGIKEHTDRLKEFWRLRQLRYIAAQIESEVEGGTPNSEELINRITSRLEAIAGQYKTSASPALVDFPDFVTADKPQIDWLLGGIIERGANGFIAAEPKGSKSFCSIDLAIAMATGSHWLGFAVPFPVKVALVSREDNPALTAWRLRALADGRHMTSKQCQMLEENLMINTRAQTQSLMLDNERDLNGMISALKDKAIEFVFLDVLNVLHGSDENDNTQMAAILRKVKRIQDKTGAAIGILHHYNKNDSGRITQRLRGASAIAGFAEWIIGISMHDDEAKIRRMDFEIKAGNSPDSIYYAIDSTDTTAKLTRVFLQTQTQQKQGKGKGVQ